MRMVVQIAKSIRKRVKKSVLQSRKSSRTGTKTKVMPGGSPGHSSGYGHPRPFTQAPRPRAVLEIALRRMVRERVQVTAWAHDFAVMKRLIKAAHLGPGVKTGFILGFKVNSIIPLGTGPEIPPGDSNIYEQSRDFMVMRLHLVELI